ncbi:MAG: DUF2089 domain-containing protein [Anaerolineae bacterium]|nr:DUF2089 domain-containing protein [Anaerolineae bacterium]
MYPLPTKCPICGGELYAERVACKQCESTIEGEFSLQQVAQLVPEQWEFAFQQLSALSPEQWGFVLQVLPGLTESQWQFLLRLARLTPEQWAFVDLFLNCEGRLNRVQEEMELSYPTVRNRLNEIIQSLGYEAELFDIGESAERQTVLDALASGNISVDDAIEFLKEIQE